MGKRDHLCKILRYSAPQNGICGELCPWQCAKTVISELCQQGCCWKTLTKPDTTSTRKTYRHQEMSSLFVKPDMRVISAKKCMSCTKVTNRREDCPCRLQAQKATLGCSVETFFRLPSAANQSTKWLPSHYACKN